MSMMKINNGSMFIAKEDGSYEKVTEFNDISEVTVDDSEIKNANEIWGVIGKNREITCTCKFDPRAFKKSIRILMGWKCKGPVRGRKIFKAREKYMKDCLLANKYINLLLECSNMDIRKSEYFSEYYPIDITGIPCRDILGWLILCIWDAQGKKKEIMG